MSYFDKVQEQKNNPIGTGLHDIRANQSELDKRMQADADLLHLVDYKILDSDGKEVPDIINVTLNRPAVFAANVISALGNARQQVVVESEDKKVDTHFAEDFIGATMQSADRRLWENNDPQLNEFADVQFCIRGRHARRVLLREVNGLVIPDIAGWDGRYVFYERGEGGLAWAAYETVRPKDTVRVDYGDNAVRKAVNNECSVLDVWDTEHNEVWIDGQLIKEQKHGWGYTPVVMQVVPLGYGQMLLDRNYEKYEGESIFFMIRQIVPELNRLASILQTLNMNQLKVALQYTNPQGTAQDEPPDRPEMGDVVSVGQGSIEPINLGEARVAAQMLYSIMEKAFQEGSYTDIDIGNVKQPFSAVALITIGENRDTVYMPRLAAKERLNMGTAEMIIQQAIQIGGTIEMGTPGHKRSFPTSKLEGEYSIGYKYFIRSPKIDIARMSLADAATRWYPRAHIYNQVLQVEDPDGMLRDWYQEEAERLSPGVKQYRIIKALLERAEVNNDEDAAREAQIMAAELGLSLDMIQRGEPPSREGPQPEGKSPIPLLPAGGQVGGTKPPIPTAGQEEGINV